MSGISVCHWIELRELADGKNEYNRIVYISCLLHYGAIDENTSVELQEGGATVLIKIRTDDDFFDLKLRKVNVPDNNAAKNAIHSVLQETSRSIMHSVALPFPCQEILGKEFMLTYGQDGSIKVAWLELYISEKKRESAPVRSSFKNATDIAKASASTAKKKKTAY